MPLRPFRKLGLISFDFVFFTQFLPWKAFGDYEWTLHLAELNWLRAMRVLNFQQGQKVNFHIDNLL